MIIDETDKEREILLRLQQGDARAFEELYHTYKSRIYYNLLRLVKAQEIAEELLQDVFMKVWERRENIDVEKSFPAFLFRIAGNLAIDFYRKAALDKKLQSAIFAASTELYEHIESGVIEKETNELLYRAIDKLPPQRQKIFRLCRIDGKTYEEAALIMGISAGTIKDHLVKANRFLRNELQTEQHLYLPLIAAVFTLGEMI